MVMNYECYPNLTRFYREHLIPLEKTDMGFSIQQIEGYRWSFSANKSNLLKLMLFKRDFWSFVSSKSKFHADALAFVHKCIETDEDPPSMTLREFCTEHGYHTAFVEGWLQPFCEAVWSSPTTAALEMEAYTILCFLRNHGFLSWTVVQWYTPKGRTTVTIKRFQKLFKELGVDIKLNAGVESVVRPPDRPAKRGGGTGSRDVQVTLTLVDGTVAKFDKVVLATPAGTALQMYGKDATHLDTEKLGGFRSTTTKIVLHTDPSLMPEDKTQWCSWNVIECEALKDRSILTYWVKQLQHHDVNNLFITLNPPPPPPESKSSAATEQQQPEPSTVLHERWAAHPVLDVAAVKSQRAVWGELQGHRNVWLAGAYLHYGFHEDGFRSGIEVARSVLSMENSAFEGSGSTVGQSIPLLPVDGAGNCHHKFAGQTSHARFDVKTQKVVHSFTYPINYDYIDVDAGFTAWWGGLFRSDHFGDADDSLSVAVRKEVCRKTGVWPGGAVDIITTLRQYGAAFNPITIYLCWDTAERGKVDFVVSEVMSTPWNQRTVHVLDMAKATPSATKQGAVVIERLKSLHVSPFNPVPDGEAKWRYTLTLPDSKLEGFHLIVQLIPDSEPGTKPKLTATMDLKNEGAPDKRWRGFVPTAWKTLFGIHVEAAKLYLQKGLSFHPNTTQSGWDTDKATDYFNGELWIRFAGVAFFLLFAWVMFTALSWLIAATAVAGGFGMLYTNAASVGKAASIATAGNGANDKQSKVTSYN